MEKIKSFFNQTIQSEKGKDVLIVIIVVLVGLGCFELGRLSKENSSGGLKIEYTDPNSQPASVVSSMTDVSPAATADQANGKNFFASSKGSKYYTISCSAGKTIKQANRVYFMTGDEAEQAGYTLSSSCN